MIKITEIIEIDTSDDETNEYFNKNRLNKAANLKDNYFFSNSQSALNGKCSIFERNYSDLSPLNIRKKSVHSKGDYVQLPIFFENKKKENGLTNKLTNNQTNQYRISSGNDSNNNKSKTEIFLEIIDDSNNEVSLKKSDFLENGFSNNVNTYSNQGVCENNSNGFKVCTNY